VARRVDQVVGHARAQQRFDRAQHGQRQRRKDELLGALPAEGRQLQVGQALRDAAELAADGLHRQVQHGGGQRGQHQHDDGAGHVRREAVGAMPPADVVQRHGVGLGPHHHQRQAGQPDGQCVGVEGRGMLEQHADLREEIGRQLGDLQAEQVLQLRQPDQHRDAVGEADDDGHRDVAHQRAEAQQPHREQQHARQRSGDQQVGQPVALHDAVDDDDEGARRAADLHLRAAQRRDEEAGDDRGDDALLGLDAAGDGEGHRQRQGDHADGQAGGDVGAQLRAAVAAHGVEQARAERV